jgi:hypothetical protein
MSSLADTGRATASGVEQQPNRPPTRATGPLRTADQMVVDFPYVAQVGHDADAALEP